MVSLAWCVLLLCGALVLLCLVLLPVGLVLKAVRALYNYASIQYIGSHINEVARVSLYPACETYKQVAIPTGYSDGWYRRTYYRYRYISKGKQRKAKVYFENNRKRSVILKEESPIYREIMARGQISIYKQGWHGLIHTTPVLFLC